VGVVEGVRRLQMNRIAEFMGWREDNSADGSNIIGDFEQEVKFILRLGDTKKTWCISRYGDFGGRKFDTYEDWNDCMLVEERVREKGLWDEYVLTLMKELGGVRYLEDGRPEIFCTSGNLMAATKQQRMEAVLKVIGDVV
jgi:hypothetical protein